MRMLVLVSIISGLVACGSSSPPASKPDLPSDTSKTPPPVGDTTPTPKDGGIAKKETLGADGKRTTVAGNTFMAPAGWTIWTQGEATIVESPEHDSRIVLVDTKAKDAEAALAAAWAAYKPDKPWKQLASVPSPDRDGWSQITRHGYETSPNEKRGVGARTMFANGIWTVLILDVAEATAEKRGSQLALVFGQLLPKGGARESFANKKANPLDATRIAALKKFVADSQELLGVPGVSFGIIENGKVVFSGGSGVRQVGKPGKPDGDTRYIIASNTKGLTTLMLAKLVDEKKLTWESSATSLMPEFKLGDADTTSKVQVKHLICACTGMPRQDLEWLFEFKPLTPATVMKALGAMQPTSKFGELFQYSNVMAAAAGFLGGHVAFPKMELGAAYDEVMRTRVFAPLGMSSTTLDFKKAQTGNFAMPYSYDIEGKVAPAPHAINYAVIPVRPAGGAWSTVNDMLKYVQMELADGKLPDGKPYVSKDTLYARRAAQVPIGTDAIYGMGLMVSTKYGVTVVHHGGDLVGYHSDMMWLPEHGIGAVILTNGDLGPAIRDQFQRMLLEVLFDGKPEAVANIAAVKKQRDEGLAVLKKQITIPADAEEAKKLAARYTNAALGDITVIRKGATTTFDLGEWTSEVASKKNPDGSVSFVTVGPGLVGEIELVVGSGDKRTLTVRDAQHEYVFTEK